MIASFYRRVWRWHFWAGLLACPALLVVALTGAIYTFREEIENRLQSDLRLVQPQGQPQLVSAQLHAVHAAHPDWKATRVTLYDDPCKSTVVQVERPDAALGSIPAVFVNPCTATVLGDGDARSKFFTTVLRLHRSLLAGTFGRVVVELVTCWTIVLIVSGLYLWLPRQWAHIWGVWLPRLRTQPYVALRDFHSVFGMITAPLAIVLAITGLFFSVVWLWSFNVATNGAGNFPRTLLAAPKSGESSGEAKPISVDVAVAMARERFPTQTLALTLPQKPTDAYQFTARRTQGSLADGSVAVDQFTGTVLSDQHAERLSFVERARLYVLPIHIGTIGGTVTKILALFTCLVLSGLAISGVWMWLIRRPTGQSGFPRRNEAEVPRPAVVVILLLAVLFPTVGISLAFVLLGEWCWVRIRRHSLDARSVPPAEVETLTDYPVPREVSS